MLGGMEEEERSDESSATAARPAPRSTASPTRAPASAAAETSTAQGKPASATPSATAHAHGASAQYILFFLIFLYLLAHGGILLQQVQLWLHDVLTGLPLMRTLLIMHEVVTLGCGILLSRAMTSSAHADELPERAFVQFAFIIPLFQCLYVAVSPTAWDGERKWWGFQATLSLLSVLCRCRPSHSLLHAIFSGLMLTLVNCYGACFQKTCDVSSGRLALCVVSEGLLIQLAGALAWAASYPLMYKSMKSRDVAIYPSPNLTVAKETQGLPQRSAPSAAATAPDLGEVIERVGSLSSLRPGNSPTASIARERPQSGSQRSSGMRQRRHHAAGASSSQGAAAKGDTSGASKQQQRQQPATREHEESAPMPLEYFGIHIFRILGLAPALRQVDLYVSSLAERVNEGMVVRVVCLPIAIHCLVYAVMARLRFLDFDYGCISYDMLFLWMGSWFMLGRDSVTFDMDKALNHLQEQLSTSLRALSKPRQQTVTELVDSVRQQIVGDDCAPCATHNSVSGEDVQLLEPLGEGTFGKVYKGIWRGSIVAIKSMVLPRSAGLRKERMAIMEAAISSALQHPNILQTYTYSMQAVRDGSVVGSRLSERPAEGSHASGAETGSQQSQAGAGTARGFEVRLITEYMDLGTLRDALDRHVFFIPPTLELDFCSVLDTAADIAKGVEHLHSLNIVHGDLKARNVLLKTCASDPRGFISKISDFGLSHKMEAEETHVSKLFQGTPTHMAPEVFLHGHQSKAADAYSFGVTLWELYSAEHAFQGVAPAMLPQKVAELGERPCFPLQTPDEYAQLAHRCWGPDVHARPTFQDIVAALAVMRKAAAGHKPFQSIAERLKTMAEVEQQSLSQDLPSAIVLGRQDTKTSTWYQL